MAEPSTAVASTETPQDSDGGLVLDVSEVRQSTSQKAEEDDGLTRAGLALAGILALIAGGIGLWRGFGRRP